MVRIGVQTYAAPHAVEGVFADESQGLDVGGIRGDEALGPELGLVGVRGVFFPGAFEVADEHGHIAKMPGVSGALESAVLFCITEQTANLAGGEHVVPQPIAQAFCAVKDPVILSPRQRYTQGRNAVFLRGAVFIHRGIGRPRDRACAGDSLGGFETPFGLFHRCEHWGLVVRQDQSGGQGPRGVLAGEPAEIVAETTGQFEDVVPRADGQHIVAASVDQVNVRKVGAEKLLK